MRSAAARNPGPTAASAALAACHACTRLVPVPIPARRIRCPRCGAPVHGRKPNSVARSWALLIGALILYFPANYFPIMTVVRFGRGTPDTIVSGVVHLAEAGEWPIAVLVFFASVLVPVVKIAVLAFLLLSVQGGSAWRPRERTTLYRITESIGRWSMIDIFMISILVGLVKLGAVATIEVGVGATSFAAVIVLTMLAAMSFDCRLIWDRAEKTDGN